jgi:hypothetical protein
VNQMARPIHGKFKEGRFEFRQTTEDTTVYYRGRCLGKITSMLEASGRYCFYLECDTRREPRTYRGRDKAAEALLIIDTLKSQAKKERWSMETLIARAWESKPASVKFQR